MTRIDETVEALPRTLRSTGSPSAGQAWQQAMEHAQAETWFDRHAMRFEAIEDRRAQANERTSETGSDSLRTAALRTALAPVSSGGGVPMLSTLPLLSTPASSYAALAATAMTPAGNDRAGAATGERMETPLSPAKVSDNDAEAAKADTAMDSDRMLSDGLRSVLAQWNLSPASVALRRRLVHAGGDAAGVVVWIRDGAIAERAEAEVVRGVRAWGAANDMNIAGIFINGRPVYDAGVIQSAAARRPGRS